MKSIKRDKSIVVLYDGVHHCLDGLCGAWVCWKKFGSRAAYIPADHDGISLSSIKNKTVYLVDISYDISIMDLLRRHNKQVIAIDHHADKKQSIRHANIYRFSDKHCGCVLAWKYFFPNQPTPKLLRYVEDLDCWWFKLPYSQEITLFLSLRALSLTLAEVEPLARSMDDPVQFRSMVSGARALFDFKEMFVKQVVANAELCQWGKYRVWVASCPEFLRSQVGHELARKSKLFGAVYYITDGTYSFSLRSSGSFDVSVIAHKYGGGGHPQASGFQWSRHKPFPFKKILYGK